LKKSIAFILPSLNAGGSERVVSTLANLLIKEYHVYIISLYKCDSFYKLDSGIKIDYCLPLYNPNPAFFTPFTNNYKLVKHLYENLKKHEIDVAIGFLPATNIYTIIACKLLKIPSIISERANPDYNPVNKFWTITRKLLYKYSNSLVVQTIGVKKFFNNYVNSEIEIINNPLNVELLEKRDISVSKENIILNVGRLDKNKNQSLLIRAFSNIEAKDWKLILVGNGDMFESYNQLIYSLGMQNQIILVGNTSDVSTYYNKSKIFAFTSNHEGFPNVIIEAMSYGLACISTDCPYGPSEIIDHGNNGILIPIGNQKALEANLLKLINDNALRETFSLNALQSIKAFSPIDIAAKWSKLINSHIDNIN